MVMSDDFDFEKIQNADLEEYEEEEEDDDDDEDDGQEISFENASEQAQAQPAGQAQSTEADLKASAQELPSEEVNLMPVATTSSSAASATTNSALMISSTTTMYSSFTEDQPIYEDEEEEEEGAAQPQTQSKKDESSPIDLSLPANYNLGYFGELNGQNLKDQATDPIQAPVMEEEEPALKPESFEWKMARLVDMGFMDVDVNKTALIKNKSDLANTVEDLVLNHYPQDD